MKRLIPLLLLALLTIVTPAAAQQAGTNVNVLPVVPAVDADDDGNIDNPYFWKFGDGYLQRQVEPTIAASTLNPDHLLSFFNDYRAVDVAQGDVGLGEGDVNSAALKLARVLLPSEIGSYLPKGELVPPMNAAEAWIGGSRSYDGGYTWSGFFLPGAWWDDSSVSENSPIYGLDASTDPVLAAGPCGTFYLTFVAFTRGGQSKIAVARYRDTNDLEGGDTIVYEGMTVIESGNNAEYGYFLDKPDIEVDILRSGGAEQCGHRVYVTYSTFNGLTKDQKVQTKMNFAMSDNGGLNFSTTKINKNFGQNQGSAIAVDPRPGEPGRTGGGGTVYVFWRHFFDPDAIIWTRTLDYGNRWSNPAILTNSPALEPFDQPTISLGNAPLGGGSAVNPGFPETGFRSNGFPTATVAPHFNSGTGEWDATVFVAWQERVGTNAGDSSTFKKPLPTGSPRIVMLRADADSPSWTGFDAETGTEGVRQAVDVFDRNEAFDPYFLMPSGAPAEPDRAAGPQVQPKLSFGGGRLMLTFYESRGRIANYGSTYESIESQPAIVDQTPYISGYDRVMDFRTTLLEPTDGAWVSSAQVSRYPLRIGANLDDGQDLSDVAAVNYPCFPDSGNSGDPNCVRQVNRINAPTSAEGSSPFIGDYPDTVPYIQFVPEGSNGWRWAIEPTDVPNRGFHAIWTDNRHLIPPAGPEEWDGFQNYGPPGIGGACENPGSRNTDVLTSRVATDVLVTAPTTYKQLDRRRSFPFSISNTTGEFRRFRLDITDGAEYATFSPKRLTPGDPNSAFEDKDSYEIIVFPYSNSSLTVYVTPLEPGDQTSAIGTILVEVTLLESTTDPDSGTDFESPSGDWEKPCSSDCLVGTIAFNAYPGNEEVQNIAGTDEDFGPEISNAFVINYKPPTGGTGGPTAFVINNFVDNAFVINAFVINSELDNAFVINDGLDNAFVINTEVQNAFVINRSEPVYGITDTVWTMAPGESNTSATYVPLPNIDNAEQLQGLYAWQLIVDKQSAYGSVDACGSYNVAQQQVLANVVQDPDAQNAFVINDFVENAFVINSEVKNAFVINSAFTMPPSSTGRAAKSLKAGAIDDSGVRAAIPDNEVRITLRAYQLVDNLPTDPYTGATIEYNPAKHPASLALFHEGCDPAVDDECIKVIGADLIIADTIDTTPLEGATGKLVENFPSFRVENIGNADALPRSGTMRHGVYLSTDEYLDVDPEKGDIDLLLTDPTTGLPDIQSAFVLDDDPEISNPLQGKNDPDRIASGEPYSEDFPNAIQDPIAVTIPADVATGEYFLILVADYPRETSEYNETNNTVAIPITVIKPNEPPVATSGSFDVTEDIAFGGNLSGSDPDGDAITFAIVSGPDYGTLNLDDTATGAFTYTPNADFNGADSFDFKVNDGEFDSGTATATLDISAVNDAPSFTKGADQTVDEDAAAQTIDGWATGLSAGPADEAGQLLTFNVSGDNPTLFSVQPTISAGGTLSYTPAANANGFATVTVTLNDDGGTSNGGVDTSAPLTFLITVNAVNDPPEVAPLQLTINEDGSATGTLSVTDPDSSTFTYAVTSPPNNGGAEFSAPGSGQFTYTPNANFNGTDSFTVTVTDSGSATGGATVTITITAVNDPPVAVNDAANIPDNSGPNTINVLGNDTDIEGSLLVVTTVGDASNGTTSIGPEGAFVTYSPNDNFIGSDSFVYGISDGSGGVATATVSITVFDAVPDWNFVGLASPWKPSYTVNVSSAIPLKWYYTDPDTGIKVDSDVAEPQIRIKGPWECNSGETGDTVEFVNDPGSSDLRYVSGDWQFNWDTGGLDTGCYNVRIYHPYTGQTNGPFRVRLK